MGKNSAIRLDSAYLSSSRFDRPPEYFQSQEEKLDLNISISKDVPEDNKLISKLSVGVTLHNESGKHHLSSIEMTGIFSYTDDMKMSIEAFANINAPAILYPFIREHLATLAAKADMKRMLLPPFNFVAFYEQNKNKN